MEDYIAAKQRARKVAEDFLSANPGANSIALSGMVVDRAGVEHSGHDRLEWGMMLWLEDAWADASRADTGSRWDSLLDMLYGALQACNSHNRVEASAVYSFLAGIARERCHQAVVDCVGFGDDE